MRPLLLFGVLYTVFTKVLSFGAGIPHYADIVLWSSSCYGFFSESTTRAVSSIPGHEHIVRKTQFPRLVIPLSIVLTGVFNLCLNLVAVFVFLIATGVTPRLTWLGLPFLLALLALLTSGVAVLFSVLFVRFRDIAADLGRPVAGHLLLHTRAVPGGEGPAEPALAAVASTRWPP